MDHPIHKFATVIVQHRSSMYDPLSIFRSSNNSRDLLPSDTRPVLFRGPRLEGESVLRNTLHMDLCVSSTYCILSISDDGEND